MSSETGAKALVNYKLIAALKRCATQKQPGLKPLCSCPLTRPLKGRSSTVLRRTEYPPLDILCTLTSPKRFFHIKSCRSPRGTSHETEPGNGHRTANPPGWRTEQHWRGGAGFTSTVASAPGFFPAA